MTPREYVIQRRSEKPPTPIGRDDLNPGVEQILAEGELSVDEALAQLNASDFGEWLYAQLEPRLTDDVRQMFADGHVAVGALADPSPNAFTVPVDGGFAILFHTGLREFIYRVARALSTRMVPAGGETKLAFGETGRIIAEILWWFVETGRSFGPGTYPIEPAQMRIAHLLATEAELFMLAHEIGHVLVARHKGEWDAPEEEHAADIYGMSMVLKLHGSEARDPFFFPLQYAGVEFALQVFRVLEVLGLEFARSHPQAGERLLMLKVFLRQKCASEEAWRKTSVLADAIESIFDDVVTLIQNPDEWEKFYTQEADKAAADLSRLLDRCTGGMVPDYMTFYADAPEIFNRGYSERLLARVAEVTSGFFDVIQTKPADEDSRRAQWIAFQKFKLLFAYIDQFMSEPARSIFNTTFARFR